MSHRVGIRDLRQNASRLLKRVSSGETIEVTDHGHPIARIVPLRAGALEQMVLEGRARRASADLLDTAQALGLPEAAESHPSVALAGLRDDER
jgi:prevent-host-death family protein